MAKSLTANQQTAIEASHQITCLMVEVQFAAGVYQRYTTAGATISYTSFDPNSRLLDWVGGVQPSSIEPIRETEQGESVGLKLTLSGIPTSQRSLVLTEQIQGRAFEMWIGIMDSAYQFIGAPVREFKGFLDIAYFVDKPDGTQDLIVEVESEETRFLRPAEVRYTDRDWQRRNPGDTICRFTAQAERTIVWPSSGFFKR